MTRALYILALLLTASSASAQEDDGIVWTEARLVGETNPTPIPISRPQLVHHSDWQTPLGATFAVAGAVLWVAGGAIYVARQNYRLRPWLSVDSGTMSAWETQGAFAFWMTAGGASLLVASEYLLLPESREVPMLAWLSGAAGLGVAAVGIGFSVGGTHCAPQALTPGANIYQACLHGTSDSLFGPMLMLTAAPLLNVPITYLLRKAFAGAPEALSFGPGGVTFSGRF
jgi:hypothetical protein